MGEFQQSIKQKKLDTELIYDAGGLSGRVLGGEVADGRSYSRGTSGAGGNIAS